jgi:energy-coupling factor transport system ATP-binding protein
VKTEFRRRHAPQREEMVRFQNVTFRYPESEHIALKDVTLSIGKSERVAIVGENGSGKTTLVKHVNNLLRPTEGEVFVNGEDIKGKTTAQMAHRVGFVFQNPEHQIFADTVFEEVAFGLRNLGMGEREIGCRVESVLSQTRLTKYKETHPFFLSGGEKQRLALASVLVCEPDILILDEPTTGLDLKSAREIVDLVMKLNAEGRTIILVTHDMKLVGEIAERIIVMKEGVIAVDGAPEEIFSDDELLKRCYLEKPPITRLAEKMGLGICLTVKDALERIK